MENHKIDRTNKSKLSEFNLEEIRGWVIDSMYQIESKIDFTIIEYFKPELKRDFEQIMLNSSIISIGGKMKILRNIKSFDKKTIEKIGKISSIRNAFAHLPVRESVSINITKDEKGQFKSPQITKITSEIEIMNSSGELKIRNVKDLISEFFELDKEINKYFLNNIDH